MFSKFFSPKKNPPKKENKEEWTKKQMKISLHNKFTGKACECCGTGHWVFTPEVIEHKFFYHADKGYTSALIVCNYCGNMKNLCLEKLLSSKK